MSRAWYPADWVDEVCPASKESPDDFVFHDGVSFILGYRADDKEALEEDREFNKKIDIGDVVTFICCDSLPDVQVTFRKDGTYQLHGQIPAEHNWARISGDQDTMHESFEDLAAAIAKDEDQYFAQMMFDTGDHSREYVEFARWSEPIPHQLILDAGVPKFVVVSGKVN